MNYYIDFEFLEGKQDKRFLGIKYGETPPTIDLISIGIVCEDGREYYAISKDFNLKEAWNRYDRKEQTSFEKYNGFDGQKVYWIRDNVLKPMFEELCTWKYGYYSVTVGGVHIPIKFTYGKLKKLIKKYGKTNKQIASEIKDFVYTSEENCCGNADKHLSTFKANPEFYGYYSNYDWVVFCWLFGKMIDLPKGFPMYCNDLKQELERLNETLGYNCDNKGNSYKMQEHKGYPKQINEHNALVDAKWNLELHKFLQNYDRI